MLLPNPCWISAEVDDRPYHHLIVGLSVEDAIRKDAALETVIVAVDDSVNAGTDTKALDVASQARGKVVTQALLLGFVE